MNDRTRKPVEDGKAELDKTFLEKNRVKETMGDLVAQLTANRPVDPLKFMADYFQSGFEQTNKLDKSFQTIMLTHHTRPAFRQNLSTAFSILNQTKVAKNLNGINGTTFDELLNLLLKDAPASFIPKMKQRLSRRQYEAVNYEAFHYAVTSVVIFKDYLEMAEQLFELLDTRSTGQVDKAYSEVLCAQLKSTFMQLSEQKDRGLQACFSLSPEGLHSVLSKVPHTTAGGKQTLNHDQFLESYAEAYLYVIEPTPD